MQVHEESAASLETPLADASVLVIPGWNGSGAGHWQTLWEQKYPGFRRVVQHNWTRPSRAQLGLPGRCALGRGSREEGGSRGRRIPGCAALAYGNDPCPAQLADFLRTPVCRLPFPSGGERRRPLLADRDRRAPGLGVGLPIRGRRGDRATYIRATCGVRTLACRVATLGDTFSTAFT